MTLCLTSWSTVAEAVFAKNRQARSTVEELLKNKTKSGISIQQAFEQHKYTLLQIDRSFRLEMSFFASVVGDGAESRLRDEVLSLLPKAGNVKTLQGVRASLDALSKSKLVEFCGVGLQGTFRSVQAIIQACIENRPPAFDGSNLSGFMALVVDRVSLFCMCDSDAPEVECSKLFGKPAAEQLYKVLLGKEVKKTAITIEDMRPLVPYSWLVPGKCVDDLRKWSAAAARLDLVAGEAAAASSSSSKPGGKAGRKRSTPDSRALVLAVLDD